MNQKGPLLSLTSTQCYIVQHVRQFCTMRVCALPHMITRFQSRLSCCCIIFQKPRSLFREGEGGRERAEEEEDYMNKHFFKGAVFPEGDFCPAILIASCPAGNGFCHLCLGVSAAAKRKQYRSDARARAHTHTISARNARLMGWPRWASINHSRCSWTLHPIQPNTTLLIHTRTRVVETAKWNGDTI